MPSPSPIRIPSSWSPEQVKAVAAMRAGLNSTDVVQIRNEMAKAPPAEHPDSVTVKAVKIPRVAVPGLEDSVEGTVDAEWLEPKEGGEGLPVLLYYHGGGYCIMSPLSHRGITGSLAAQGLRVLSLDYRMAPEHPYPAPIVDALSAYKYVLSLGIPASKICMAGDSAGGGLTYATAMYLRDNPSFAPQVAGICPISPWIDLTTSSPSVFIGDEFDADIINRGSYSNTSMQVAYAGGVEQRAKKQMLPLFSPFFDDKKGGLPPALASLATVDRLFAEDLAYYIPRLEKNEATVQVDVYEDQFHIFQFLTFTAQSQTCFKRMADFIRLATTSPSSIKTSYNWIPYDGHAQKLKEGVGKLREWLASIVERADKDGEWAKEGVGSVKEMYRKVARK